MKQTKFCQKSINVLVWSFFKNQVVLSWIHYYDRHSYMSRIDFTLVPASDLFELHFHFDSGSFSQIKIPG